jgi:hypothetical protein
MKMCHNPEDHKKNVDTPHPEVFTHPTKIYKFDYECIVMALNCTVINNKI